MPHHLAVRREIATLPVALRKATTVRISERMLQNEEMMVLTALCRHVQLRENANPVGEMLHQLRG